MRERITDKMLQRKVEYLNELTDSPKQAYTRTDDGLRGNIGHYYISGAYGGVKLERIVNEGGGCTEISRDGYGTKRELWTFLCAYVAGIEFERAS